MKWKSTNKIFSFSFSALMYFWASFLFIFIPLASKADTKKCIPLRLSTEKLLSPHEEKNIPTQNWSSADGHLNARVSPIKLNQDRETILINDRFNNLTKELNITGPILSVFFSNSGQLIKIYTSTKIQIYNVSNLTIQSRPLSKEIFQHAELSPNGREVALSYDHKQIEIINSKEHQRVILTTPGIVTNLHFSPDGNNLIASTHDGQVLIYKKINDHYSLYQKIDKLGIIKHVQINPNSQTFSILNFNHILSLIDLNEECVLPITITSPAKNIDDFKILDQHKTFCEKDFTPQLNLALTRNQKIDYKEAIFNLLLFQKVNVLDIKTHLPIILGLLNSPLIEKHPYLIFGMLQTVLYYSPPLYQKLIKLYPSLSYIDFDTFSEAEPEHCRSQNETKLIKEKVKNYLSFFKTSHSTNLRFKDLEYLTPLRPILKDYTPEEKEYWLHGLGEIMAKEMSNDPAYYNLCSSKIINLFSQMAGPFFGYRTRRVTDLTTLKENDKTTFMILSTYPINENPQTLNVYGLYTKKIRTINNNQLIDQQIEWSVDETKFKAQIKATPNTSRTFLKRSIGSPDYNRLWADKALSGIILGSSNLSEDEVKDTVNQYKLYFINEGFQFIQEEIIFDTMSYLQEKITSSTVDYLIKEAHTGGDEKNVIRLAVKSKIARFQKIYSDHRIEKIDIVFPNLEEKFPDSILLSNENFGKWIQKREENLGTELIYFNASCFSKTKAINEIQSANSHLLVEIPTLNLTRTFFNQKHNAEYLLLSSFRKGEKFSKMREHLQSNSEYAKGIGNTFLFPDEAIYQEKIMNIVQKTPTTEIQIFDDMDESYNLDDPWP